MCIVSGVTRVHLLCFFYRKTASYHRIRFKPAVLLLPGIERCHWQITIDTDIEGAVVTRGPADEERLVRDLQPLEVVPVLLCTLQQLLEVVSQWLEVLPEALQLVGVAEEEIAAGHVLDDGVAPLPEFKDRKKLSYHVKMT
jgi:hypothetical protein